MQRIVENTYQAANSIWNNLGTVKQDQGYHEQAVQHYEEAYNILIKYLGKEHPNVIKIKLNLEQAKSDMKK